MAARRPSGTLRAVKAGEKAPTRARKTTVAGAKTPRELLVAVRDRIAKAIDDPNTPARDLAALTKRIGEVVRDIEALDAREAEESASQTADVGDGDFDASAV